jgi:hypothetical protein
MEDFYRQPPVFPLVVKDALLIMHNLVNVALDNQSLEIEDSVTLSTTIRNIAHDSFWGGIHLNDNIKNQDFLKCLAHTTDDQLNKYWANVGSKKQPPIIRSVAHEMYQRVPYYHNQLNTDIDTIKSILVGKCEPSIIESLVKNIRAISEILILDGNTLSNSYCNNPLDISSTTEAKIDTRSGLEFQPKTFMISERTHYALATAVVIASGIIVWYNRKKLSL